MTDQPKDRKRRTSSEKLALLKRHLVKGEAVSDICDSEGVSPTQFYTWQKQLFDNGASALDRKNKSTTATESKKVQQLQSQLAKANEKLSEKHEVLSELMSEHIKLKKSIGD